MTDRKTVRAWTQCYAPFILGGNVHQPIRCEVAVEDWEYSITRGTLTIKLLKITSPGGTEFIVDEASSGVVGDDAAEVIRDIDGADVRVLRLQITKQTRVGETARPVDEETFWRHLEAAHRARREEAG